MKASLDIAWCYTIALFNFLKRYLIVNLVCFMVIVWCVLDCWFSCGISRIGQKGLVVLCNVYPQITMLDGYFNDILYS
ncbi:hypothetical protein RIF29_06359 [Crotalaria pallida]|uniref:Uncharacterized protein n=1 Tax=Crotalaria pallida TaxID=3830 RepID=A0AAN9J460_CROPI